MNKILIAHEKHCKRYFDASTDDLRNAACLKILSERFDRFFYDYSLQEPSDKNILSDGQIAQLPTENLKAQELRKRKDYLEELRQYKKEIEFYNAVKSTIESRDGLSAYYLLLQRDDGEYEGFDIEDLEDA